jgi:hypothetical protein
MFRQVPPIGDNSSLIKLLRQFSHHVHQEVFPMSLTEQSIQTALQTVVDPNTGKDLVTSRSAKNIKINGADV